MPTTMKVFDQKELPRDAREQIESYYEDKINDNCYIWHSCCRMVYHEERLNLVDDFLLKNGIKDDESVLFNIYW